ncbi:hypothetical protein [Streptomyces sp. NPDC056982]|uniref:hypothetical protein n=1 Tax=Streptomyces sp. NPDC056982 TaxID=3345986 RepID=UPI003634B408
MTAPTPSIQELTDTYAKDVAVASGAEPTSSPSVFIAQLRTASINLDDAGINGSEYLDNAAVYLEDALNSTDQNEVQILTNRAARYLEATADLVGKYRALACD